MNNEENKPKTQKRKIARVPIPGGLLDPKAAAARLMFSEWTLAAWRVEGKGPKFMRLGNRIRYSSEALAEWEQANEAASTSEHDARKAG